jgi:salicylate hydroxylase
LTGIHIPPNAARILSHLGVREKLFAAGGYEVKDFTLRRYQDGRVIVKKPLKGRVKQEYGAEWMFVKS